MLPCSRSTELRESRRATGPDQRGDRAIEPVVREGQLSGDNRAPPTARFDVDGRPLATTGRSTPAARSVSMAMVPAHTLDSELELPVTLIDGKDVARWR